VTYTDGHVVDLAPDDFRVLRSEEIDAYFADDPEKLEEARAALIEHELARDRAAKAYRRSRMTPEAIEIERLNTRWYHDELLPAHRAHAAALNELRSFRALTPGDRFAQTLALYELQGGKITPKRRAVRAEDAFENDEGNRLATLLFEGLAAAVVAPPPFDAVGWLDAWRRIPGHAFDRFGAGYLEPEAWPEGDYSKAPAGAVMWRALSPEQKAAVLAVARERDPLPEWLVEGRGVYTPIESGDGPVVIPAGSRIAAE
jgi:hypothetical protein